MRAFLRLADGLALFGAVVAGLSLATLVVLSGAEIVLRSFFAKSLTFVVEYNGYLLALTFIGGCGQAMREGGHIRVTMLPQALPPSAAKALDVACTFVGLGLAGYLCASMTLLAQGSFAYGTLSFYASRTPLGYPQAAVALLLAIFVLSLLARLVRLVTGEAPDRSVSTGTGAH